MKYKSINLSEMRPRDFIIENKNLSDNHVERVRHGSGFKPISKCPLCSSSENSFFLTKSTINYVQCKNCLCTYPNLMPVDIGDIYKGEEYLDEFIVVDGEREEYKKKRFGRERLEVLYNQIGGSLKGKKLLDVGCGTGWFLELCSEEGLDCYGQEIGNHLASFSNKRTGANMINEPVESISGYDDFFDIIVLFDLIEHIENPISFVNKLKSMLIKDGLLFIMTPNIDSFGVQCLQANSSLLMPTDHICLFASKTATVLAEIVGMRLDWISYNGIDIGDYLAFLDSQNYELDERLKQKLYDDLQPIIDQFSFSNHFRFILKK